MENEIDYFRIIFKQMTVKSITIGFLPLQSVTLSLVIENRNLVSLKCLFLQDIHSMVVCLPQEPLFDRMNNETNH